MTSRIVDVRQHVLKKNDVLARTLRRQFEEAGVFVVSLVSSPGAGKTTMLEKTLRALVPVARAAALVGDLATDRDAERLRASGAPVRQITTGTVCHLDAEMVASALRGWELAALDFLFIENVGNLVCPASYDLGEHLRVVLLSVTEGEDKPLKYPTIFNTADLAMITKTDLASAAEFDRAAALDNIAEMRPGLEVLEVSARTGAGMSTWIDRLHSSRGHLYTPLTENQWANTESGRERSSTQMEIRPATPFDADAIRWFDEIARVDLSRRACIDRSIDSGQCVVATVEGRAVAYAIFNYAFYVRGFVDTLYVQREFRHRGIGSALMRHIAAHCQTPTLFTSTNQSNAPMQTLLGKLGYERSGIIENLDEGDPELVYVKRLRHESV